MTASTVSPDWVMVGWREAGECVLLASGSLTAAQLDYRAREYQFRDVQDMRRRFKPQKTLTAHMDDYLIIRAATYAECLAELLFKHQWRPDEPRTIEGTAS